EPARTGNICNSAPHITIANMPRVIRCVRPNVIGDQRVSKRLGPYISNSKPAARPNKGAVIKNLKGIEIGGA
ncbi:MAG: hypothetical protein OQK42_03455, partial [Sedimenticola sp.]|nr:hypothetical protein [Sedimenticola sp.]